MTTSPLPYSRITGARNGIKPVDDLLIVLPSRIRSAAMAVKGAITMLPMDRPPAPAVMSLLARAAQDLEALVGQVELWTDGQRRIEGDRRMAAAKAASSRIMRQALKRRR